MNALSLRLGGLLVAMAVMLTPTPAAQVVSAATVLPDLRASSLERLPHYTYSYYGTRMAPVGFVYAGTEEQIVDLYTKAGWTKADRNNPLNLYRAWSAIQGRREPYPAAPVTPVFVGRETQELAFNLPTSDDGVTSRHHTRLWETDYYLPDGRQIWVGSASYDTSVGQWRGYYLPWHHIDPRIDEERAFIVASLDAEVRYAQFVPAQEGNNAIGDRYVTDGRVAITMLPVTANQSNSVSAQPQAPATSVVRSSPSPAPAASPAAAGAQAARPNGVPDADGVVVYYEDLP